MSIIKFKYCLLMYLLFKHVHIPRVPIQTVLSISTHVITLESLKIFMKFSVKEFYKKWSHHFSLNLVHTILTTILHRGTHTFLCT